MGDRITYIGLDVHKDGIAVATAEGGLRGEVRDYGRIANTPAALDREIAWKAQLWLCAHYRKLARGSKPANVVTAAIARELAGFIWAIARRVPPAGGLSATNP